MEQGNVTTAACSVLLGAFPEPRTQAAVEAKHPNPTVTHCPNARLTPARSQPRAAFSVLAQGKQAARLWSNTDEGCPGGFWQCTRTSSATWVTGAPDFPAAKENTPHPQAHGARCPASSQRSDPCDSCTYRPAHSPIHTGKSRSARALSWRCRSQWGCRSFWSGYWNATFQSAMLIAFSQPSNITPVANV